MTANKKKKRELNAVNTLPSKTGGSEAFVGTIKSP